MSQFRHFILTWLSLVLSHRSKEVTLLTFHLTLHRCPRHHQTVKIAKVSVSWNVVFDFESHLRLNIGLCTSVCTIKVRLGLECCILIFVFTGFYSYFPDTCTELPHWGPFRERHRNIIISYQIQFQLIKKNADHISYIINRWTYIVPLACSGNFWAWCLNQPEEQFTHFLTHLRISSNSNPS